MHGKPVSTQQPEPPPESVTGRAIRKGHVGLIVAGSMISGFVVALALVIGLFAGAQEHVIMGTALFGWALGWALLAVLSMRWTDQPRRWAVVPATLLALAGASLLVFKPDANVFNVLGWIWPPALIALAVWMTMQARQNLHSLTRRSMLCPLFAALVFAGVGGSYVGSTASPQHAGWLLLQDAMTGLSTNSAHRVLPDTGHTGLINDRIGAAQASQAILDVVASVRGGTPLAKASARSATS